MKDDKTAGDDPASRQWAAYAKATSERAPRGFLVDVAGRFEQPGFAIDIGCGAGVECSELLRLGWRVLALDHEPKAIATLLDRTQEDHRERLETQVVEFQNMKLPAADLIWAGRSLPFASPSVAALLWSRIVRAVVPGGRIACDLFGERHAWSENEEMNSVTAASIEASLDGFEIERLQEFEREQETVFDGVLHWHAFMVVARKM